MRECREWKTAITAINAMSGPKTNAPVIAASTELSWVLLEKDSVSSIPLNSPTRYPPMASKRASQNVFTGVGYGTENVESTVGKSDRTLRIDRRLRNSSCRTQAIVCCRQKRIQVHRSDHCRNLHVRDRSLVSAGSRIIPWPLLLLSRLWLRGCFSDCWRSFDR